MLFLLINRVSINRDTTASGGIRIGFSQSMANAGVSDGNQSQDCDRGLHAVWRSINKQQQSIQNLTQQLETIQP